MRSRETRESAIEALKNALNEDFPFLRIGQFIVNVFSDVDLFYIEDERFQDMIVAYKNAERIVYPSNETQEESNEPEETTENETN